MSYIQLDIPYDKKDWAKKNRAMWLQSERSWFIPFRRYYGKQWLDILHYAKPINQKTMTADRFYVAQGVKQCYLCKKETNVYSIYLTHASIYEPVEILTHTDTLAVTKLRKINTPSLALTAQCSNIRSINKEANAIIDTLTQGTFKPTQDDGYKNPFFSNHCQHKRCAAKQGDFPLFFSHSKPLSTQSVSLHKVERRIILNADLIYNQEVFL